MALQFPTYTPAQPVTDLLSGIQTGMALRERYNAYKQANQLAQMADEQRLGALLGRQLQSPQSQPLAQQQSYQAPSALLSSLQQAMPQAQQIPSQASAMATPRQLPLAQTPADQFIPASNQPAPDQSAATLATGMTKRGSLPAMSDYIFGRPSTTGPNPVLNVMQTKDGRTVLLPSRINGKRLDINQARAYYKKTGQHLGEFESPEAAMKYAYSLATNTLEPEQSPVQPEAISGATPVPASEISPAPMAEQAGMETRPDQTQPMDAQQQFSPAPAAPLRPSAKNLLELGEMYGLDAAFVRKHPAQAMGYIESKQAQEQEQRKTAYDQYINSIKLVESAPNPMAAMAAANALSSAGLLPPSYTEALKSSAKAQAPQPVYSPTGEVLGNIITMPDGTTKFAEQKAQPTPKVANIVQGDSIVTAQYNPKTGEWVRIGGGPRFKPNLGGGAPKETIQGKHADVVMGELVKKMPALQEKAEASATAVTRIDEMLGLLRKGAGGKLGKLQSFLAPYAEAVGINLRSLNEARQYELLAQTLGGSMRLAVVGPGAVSNYEQKLLQKVNAGGDAGRGAAVEILNFYRKAAENNISNYNKNVLSVDKWSPETAGTYPQINPPRSTGKPSTTGARMSSSGRIQLSAKDLKNLKIW